MKSGTGTEKGLYRKWRSCQETLTHFKVKLSIGKKENFDYEAKRSFTFAKNPLAGTTH
jgi:hypothetical protein